ncbi:Nitrogen permease regulator 3 [Podila clonocystis]|nr:Nitrogen permease regulator 3 [Podila clonocystis]
MNGLVGILIVTNSSRGHHFVYKYPREPQKPTLDHASDITANTRDLKSSKPMHQHGDEFQTTSKVLGYDPQFLANLLSPKLALCDKRFQLTVDDLTFIGHPVSLTGPEFRQQRDLLKRTRLPKPQVKRGWVVGGTPFMDDESDSDYFQDSDNDDDDESKDIN